MTKEQKAFDNITTLCVGENGNLHIGDMDTYYRSCEIVEKVIESMQIAKDKNVDILAIKNCDSVVLYNVKGRMQVGRNTLTQEEFELLKKVFR